MKKFFTRISMMLMLSVFAYTANAQLTGTKTIPGDYATLAAAVADLNLLGVGAGGVTINITAAGGEVAPSTGISLTATGTSANPITIQNLSGAVYTITAGVGTATPASATQDGILRLVGSDYVTIDGLTLVDNNTANPATMEYGIALYKAGSSNGCQNVLIQNCSITLNKINNALGTAPMTDGSAGILMMNAVPTTATTAIVPISADGANKNNTFIQNTIKNVNIGISMIGFADASPFTLADRNNSVGGSKASNGNFIYNFGGGGTTSAAAGIRTLAQYDLNVSNNTLNNVFDAGGAAHATTLRGIYTNAALGASTTINNNTITLKSLVTTPQVAAIENVAGASGTTNRISISNNKIKDCTNTLATSSTWYGIYSTASASKLIILNNIYTNNQTNATTGVVHHIYNSGAIVDSVDIENNSISHAYVGAIANSGTSYGIYNASGTGANHYSVVNGNDFINFTNVTTGTNTRYYLYTSNTTRGATMNSNTVSNITANHSGTTYLFFMGSTTTATGFTQMVGNSIVGSYTRTGAAGTFYGAYTTGSTLGSVNISNNNISNVTQSTAGTGTFYGVWDSNGGSPYTSVKSNQYNTVSNFTRLSTGIFYGMYPNNHGLNTVFANNTIDNLTTNGTTYTLYVGSTGNATATATMQCHSNKITNITNNSATALTAGAYMFSSACGVKFYKNKIANITGKAASGITYGIYWGSAQPFECTNNYIGNITSPNYTSATSPFLGCAGIFLNTGTINQITNNTVYLNNAGVGANVTTAAIYATATGTLNSRNNIFVNTSTPNGTGKAVGMMKSTAVVTNLGVLDNNMYHIGTPGAANVMYWDGTTSYQTLADYKTGIAKEALSITETPLFLSTTQADPTYLHYNTAVATGVESGGATIAVVSPADDYDGQARQGQAGYSGTGVAPDMGADEFEGIPVFTCTTPLAGSTGATVNPVCFGASTIVNLSGATVTGTGNSYQWQSAPVGGSFTNITGATAASYAVTPTEPKQYQCIVTCQNGPSTSTSTPLTVNFAFDITSATPGVRCGTGSVDLVGIGTAPNISWFTTQTGGASIGSSASNATFATPSISATTTYYAAATGFNAGAVQVGTGTTTATTAGINPIASGWENQHVQYLVTATELAALGLVAGNINSLAFNITSANTRACNNYTIKIGNTATSAMTTTYLTPTFTTVYGPLTLPLATVGLNTFTFTTPHNWDGTSNIVIDICYENDVTATCTACYGTAATFQYTATTFNSVFGTYADNTPACGIVATTASSTYTFRPNMIFAGTTACSSNRIPVIATVNPSPVFTMTGNKTICNDAIESIAVTSTLADFDTYAWTPVTNLFTDAACTTPYTAGASAATVYVKGTTAATTTYTCNASNTVTLCAAVSTAIVTILPGAVTLAGLPTTPICVSGAATVSLTPATGYPTGAIQWQNSVGGAAFADIAGANAATYISPSITESTDYQAVIKDGLGAVCLTTTTFSAIVNSPSIVSSTPGSRCGTGTVDLGATVSPGSTLSWFTTATGGTPVASGAIFTTPVITTSTNYYASAAVLSPGTTKLGISTTTSNTAGINPFASGWENQHTQYLVSASDLISAGLATGNINSLGFHFTSVNTRPSTGYTVKIGTTTATVMTAAYLAPTFTTVYGPVLQPVATIGLNTINFTTPFAWDGASNLVIDICYENDPSASCASCYATGPTYEYSTTSYSSTWGTYSDNTPACGINAGSSATLTSNRPNMTFNGIVACRSNRTTVLATVNTPPAFTVSTDRTACNGAITPLSVTSTLADFDTYTWSPVTNLYSDAAATTPLTATDNFSTVYLKGTTAVATTYTSNALNTVSACANSAIVVATTLPATLTAVATPADICISGSTTINLTPAATATGTATFQWQNSGSSYANIAGANATSYTTPVITATESFQAVVKDAPSGNTCFTTSPLVINVNNPTISATTPATRCGTGTVALEAVSSSPTINWYGAATGGSLLGTGATFTTPSIASTTTYYVAASAGSSSSNVSKLAPEVASTGTALTTYGQDFTVTQGFTLSSVKVFSTTGTSITVSLYSAGGTTQLQTTGAQSVVAGTSPDIALGWYIAPGTYRLCANGMTGNFIRDNSGVTYPLALGTVGTMNGFVTAIAGTVSTGSSYYFLYNWNIITGCESARQAVVATVTAADPITASAAPTSICVGQSTTLGAASANTGYTYTWSNGSTGASVPVTPAASTTYNVNGLDAAGCAAAATVSVAVNPLPGNVMVTPATASVIAPAIQTLTATGGTTAGTAQVGTGAIATSTAGVTPFTSNYENSHIQYLFTAAELSGLGITAGSINSIEFTVTTASAYAQTNYTVKMAPTASTALSGAYGTPSVPFVTVYNNPLLPIQPVGLSKLNFTTPFTWNGTSNILIDICHENDVTATCSGCFGTNASVAYTSTTGATVFGTYADNTAACGINAATASTAFTNRPNIKFYYGLTAPITWSPTTELFTDAAATVPYTGGTANIVYSKPSANIVYTAVATSAAGCTKAATATLTVDGCTNNATLSALNVGPNVLNVQCNTDTFTYYGTGSAYSLGVAWRQGSTPANNLAYLNASASIKKFATTPSIINAALGNGTFMLKSIWNVEVAGNQPSAPVIVRFMYDVNDSLAMEAAADAFLAALPPPAAGAPAHIKTAAKWFKSISGEFDPSNPIFNSQIGNIEPTQVIELTPTKYGALSYEPSTHWVEFFVNSFSGGTEAVSAGDLQTPLPVVFKAFRGFAAGKVNTLTWEAGVQLNTKEYRLERSTNGRDWSLVSIVAANASLKYSVNDMNPVCNAYYRVIGVDNDGRTWNTQVLSIARRCDKFNITNAYPNPTSDAVMIQYESVGEAAINMTVTDMLGRIVTSRSMDAKDGFNTIEVDLSAYANGAYFITLNNGTEQVTQRIVKN